MCFNSTSITLGHLVVGS